MDDQFPDQIQTKTSPGSDGYHTAPNQRQGSVFSGIDQAYLRSLPAIIHIVQIVLSFFFWVILAAVNWYYGFALFTGISAMIQTGIYFTVFLFRVNEKITIIAWELSEFICNCVVCGCYILSAILTSITAADSRGWRRHGALVFCTLLAWGLCLLYGISILLSYRTWTAYRQRRSQAPMTTTTTTTTTTNQVIVVEGAQQYPPADPYGPPAYKP